MELVVGIEGMGRKDEEERSWGSIMVEAGLENSSSSVAAVRAAVLEADSKGWSLGQ